MRQFLCHKELGESVLLERTNDGDGIPWKRMAGPFYDTGEAITWLEKHLAEFDVAVRKGEEEAAI